jgi:F-type H+-transporting ATPase subunit b
MFNLFLAFAEEGAAAAHDAHTTHADVLDAANWLPGVTALVVFGIVLLILGKFVWPKITKALDERDAKIRHEIESAEQAREQAKAALSEYQRNLASAREEANAMITKAKADAKAVAEELRSRNEVELTEMKQRATREIEAARHAAVTSLYNEASTLAVAIAGKILEREISPGDQKRMIDESLHQLAKAGKN